MKIEKIALVGNPNSGKSSVFNQLTGLNQKVGNYPGVTVDKKTGTAQLNKHHQATLIDLPGTYSLYPRSEEEQVVKDFLSSPEQEDYPDLTIVVIDTSNLERNFLLLSQIYDLKIPIILVLNMMDLSQRKGQHLDIQKLSGLLGGVPVIPFNARKGQGLEELKEAIIHYRQPKKHYPFVSAEEQLALQHKKKTLRLVTDKADSMPDESPDYKPDTDSLPDNVFQVEETKIRYNKIKELLRFTVQTDFNSKPTVSFTHKFDKILVHPIGGYAIFLAILFLIFQAVYSFAEWPMNLIDGVFLQLSKWTKSVLAAGTLTDLIAEGIIPGLGGVLIFIPQIVILFLFIALLEESGYMARVVFIMDRLMRPFGLNGKSVVPLMSGLACAIPAIMATRTIGNWKERMVTIMVTPLMSCAARLPVYTLLIALVIPDKYYGGIIGLKGLTLFGLYLLGLLAALGAAYIFNLVLKTKQQSFLVFELPDYKIPDWRNILLTLWEKTKVFVLEAGKIILAISIILWVLASHGPKDRMEAAAAAIPLPDQEDISSVEAYENALQTAQLENSWIGLLGKQIEPAIAPLGYDWKIGISLITSFAAREVFVGSMATIYSVGEDFEDNDGLLIRMGAELNPRTGLPVYSLASGLSLMLFYAFAMQCMSTLAIVYRETKSWKWPLIQMIYMTVLAYLAALIVYQMLQ